MARPRTPTKILELTGAFKKHPERKRKDEPKPNAKFNPRPPGHLDTGQRKSWREIVKMIPAGVLGDGDRIQVETAACLLAEYRELKGAMSTQRIGLMERVIGKLGLNPSARATLVIEKPKTNKYADE